MVDNHEHPCNRRRVLMIDDLPDDDLLTIFDFYVAGYENQRAIEALVFTNDQDRKREIESWQSLVHVCRRWRALVFGSPRRLKLQLWCTTITPARETMDVWPTLPVLIRGDISETSVDNVIAVLEHSDRIYQIEFNFQTTLQIEKIWTAMQAPFPELRSLYLSFRGVSYEPALPDSFLVGSAPRLEFLSLVAVPFRGILSSVTHLRELHLIFIPHSEYISPEAMVACLTMLTYLNSFGLEFKSPQSCPDQENRRFPPPTRSVLPYLGLFLFKGANEYLEELVARIDTPQLSWLSTTFFNDIDFDIPELIQFISRIPKFGAFDRARLIFDYCDALVRLQSPLDSRKVEVCVLCEVLDWQVSSLAQICTLSLHFFSTMETLYIHEDLHSRLNLKDDIEDAEWLDLLLPFKAVKNLYLSKQFSPHIARVLQELTGGRTTEVLPVLQNILLEGFQPSEPVHEGIGQFISARQLSNLPVRISEWERDPEQELNY